MCVFPQQVGFDLSKAMGIPGDVFNKKVKLKLKDVIEKTKKKNISIGTIATSKDHINELISLGVNFIVYLVDMNVLSNAYTEIKESFDKFNEKWYSFSHRSY